MAPMATAVLGNELDQQFTALMDDLAWWSQHAPATGTTAPARVIQDLLGEIKSFFEVYYDYFKNAANLPADRPLYTVLRTVVKQLLEQSDTVTRMLAQRRPESPYQEDLLKADKQAKQFYDRFTGYKPGSDRPLVYFEKQYQITRFAYGPPPVIAIPLGDRGSSNPLPLAHELGHYVIWNSADNLLFRQLREELRKVLTTRLQVGYLKEFLNNTVAGMSRGPAIQGGLEQMRGWLDSPNVEPQLKLATTRWGSWLVEMFADVFGTLVAGIEFARSSQSRLLRDTITRSGDLLRNDGLHPLPALRPLIATETLRYIGVPTTLIDELEESWKPQLDQAQKEFEKQAPLMETAAGPKQVNAPEFPPSPTVMAGMIPVLVEGLLKEKIFHDATPARTPTLLLELIVPPNQPIPPRVATSRRASTTVSDSALKQLLGCIRADIASGREKRPEWEALLDVELVSTAPTDHTGVDTHWHYLSHYHDYYNQVISA